MKVEGVICKKLIGVFYIVVKLLVENVEDFIIWMLKEFNKDNEIVMVCFVEGFYVILGLGCDEIRLVYILNEKDFYRVVILLKEGLE